MDFVLLQSFDNYIDAHILMGRLEEEGIRCWLKDENIVSINPIFNNVVGGIKLMVAKEQAVRAQDLLQRFREERKSRQACPFCGSHEIEFVASRKPLNILGAIASWLAGNYAVSSDNIWHCFHCHREFEKPVESRVAANDSRDAGPGENEGAL